MPNLGLDVSLDTENSAVVINAVDKDNKRAVVDTRSFPASRINENLRLQVALYGLSKLLQDRTSSTSVNTDGLEAKFEAMESVLARFESGEWAAERKIGAPTVSAEIEAIASLKGTTVSVIQKKLRTMSKEQKEKIFANEQVAALAAEIKASREGAEDVSLEDLG